VESSPSSIEAAAEAPQLAAQTTNETAPSAPPAVEAYLPPAVEAYLPPAVVAAAVAVPAEPAAEPVPQAIAQAASVDMVAPKPVEMLAPIAVSKPVSEEQLKANLSEVGLQWVQTSPDKVVSEAAPESPPKLGRAPKRNHQEAPQEPLVMVETRHDTP
jgi:hypothetical protein